MGMVIVAGVSRINEIMPDKLPPLPLSLKQRDDAARRFAQWVAAAGEHEAGDFMRAIALESHAQHALLAFVFGHSPYLSQLAMMHPGVVKAVCEGGPEAAWEAVQPLLTHKPADIPELMKKLRTAKAQTALLTALADIGRMWPLERVTEVLSLLAEKALTIAINSMLAQAAARGEVTLKDHDNPSEGSGLVVLGMGKLGGRELNYSSDIDLILFFEPGMLDYRGRQTEQHFMNKLAHDLVAIMQERTAQGYVFRTDLRLRPDPASTPPVVAISAAYYYYESVGQNWERAAMIKARPVAGDLGAGDKFLRNIAPFMWRRSLDFASINDIHSIKRQMDTLGRKAIAIPGHNVKLGMGGIREIEFYVQIHQLIWGGREPVLRTRATCDTLDRLVEYGLVDGTTRDLLREAYGFYRTLEHRLQMVADEQTHSLPEDEEGIAAMARFMGFESREAFEATLLDYLTRVHGIYASSFKGIGEQSEKELGIAGNLVFTGTQHDPDTLQTLRDMGYTQPETVSEIVMGWHHGSRRATRTKRARELLTELMPTLLRRLSETINPDAAFLHFDAFLKDLPSGVQLFSLFSVNPQLLGLISDIMGSAPALADQLSKSPEWLDSVLYADFYGKLPGTASLKGQLKEQLHVFTDTEARLDALRRFRHEKQFQAGVQLLKGMVDAKACGYFLSDVADVVVQEALDIVTAEFAASYGSIPGARFAVMSLGRLGSREMAFGSDIDLVFVYEAPDFEAVSDGEKSFTASVYFNRLAQRFVNALAAMGRYGRLYEVDTRLRPSGKQGLLAVSTQALTHYFAELAWTFEFMALVKGRCTLGDASLCAEIEAFRRAVIRAPRDGAKMRADAREMREKVEQQHGTPNIWDLKHVRGGLMDIDFLAQALLLAHASELPALPTEGSSAQVLGALAAGGALAGGVAEELMAAHGFMAYVFNMLRLCSPDGATPEQAGAGLKNLLAQRMGMPDFAALSERLIHVEQTVQGHYSMLLA